MATRENEFEISLGKIRGSGRPELSALRSAVAARTWKGGRSAGRIAPRTGMRGHYAKAGKGAAKSFNIASRRVVVKARFVAHGSARGAPLKAHVAYLARETKGPERAIEEAEAGASKTLSKSIDYLEREAAPAEARVAFYNGGPTAPDARAIIAGWANDARHFRLIVSAEDGEALGDLKPFIREIMAGLEHKLGTKLEWLAVDHHDTDNPHSHVLIRGKRADGSDLFIPSRTISSGIREHAQEIATRVLGPRRDVDLAKERAREIGAREFTALDRELLGQVRHRGDGSIRPERADLAARVERLGAWGLADELEGGSWRIADGLQASLKAMAAHDEVERVVARVRVPGESTVLLEADPAAPEMGRLIHAGMLDAFSDTFLAVIETGCGEHRFARLEAADDLARLTGIERGAIVTFEPNAPAVRPSDEAVARIAGEGGVYSADLHARMEPSTSRGMIEANIRRLEAMRRAGLVERRSDGSYAIAPDHLDRAVAYEERVVRLHPVSARIASYWTLSEQVEALGPTQLDQVLAGTAAPVRGEGAFARDHAAALQQRRLFLVEQGWMGQEDLTLSQRAIQQMAAHETKDLAQTLAHELNRPILSVSLSQVSGVYARRIDLAQGRVALILQDTKGVLVPWRPALERFGGREVEGLMRGQTLSWKLQQARGIGLPPM